MNITPVNLFNIKKYNYKPVQMQTAVCVRNNGTDSVSFSGIKTMKSRDEILDSANKIKEQMKDCYASTEAECSLSPSGIKTFTERYGMNEAYMTLQDETKKRGIIASKSAVFKEGRLQKAVVSKTKNGREIEKETYYFDTANEELKRYVAELDNSFFGMAHRNHNNVTRTEYVFKV